MRTGRCPRLDTRAICADSSLLRGREILLKASVNVVALQRSESAQLTSLADKYPGVLIISKGDVSRDGDNKASATRGSSDPFEGHHADAIGTDRRLSKSQCSPSVAWTHLSVRIPLANVLGFDGKT